MKSLLLQIGFIKFDIEQPHIIMNVQKDSVDSCVGDCTMPCLKDKFGLRNSFLDHALH